MDYVLVSEYCDRDYGIPTDRSSGFDIVADSLIQITRYLEQPVDEELRVHRKDTFIDYYEVDYETLYYYDHLVMSEGSFRTIENGVNEYLYEHEFTLSNRIIDETVLLRFDASGLRLLRNEIFARKGYQFRSEDLKEHFSQFNWYEPRHVDAEDLALSEIERINIALISSQEALLKR
ncbi:MAG: YARHG domain-containing protein [Bacteroidota bacterium]